MVQALDRVELFLAPQRRLVGQSIKVLVRGENVR